MPPLGRAHHHPATQGLHAHPCHMQADQEGEADAPTSSHGGRGPGQSHPRDGTKGSSVPRVSSVLHEHMSLRALCHIWKLMHPPPLMEGEALASCILEMGPKGAQFLG